MQSPVGAKYHSTRQNKRWYVMLLLLISICIVFHGCSQKENQNTLEMQTERIFVEEKSSEEELEDTLLELYKKAYCKQERTNQDAINQIMEALENMGFVSIDEKNQMEMTNRDKIENFIRQKEQGQKEQIRVFVLSYAGAFTSYNLSTSNGEVLIRQRYYQYFEDQFRKYEEVEYDVNVFNRTEEGYLMMEGTYRSEEKYVLTLSDEVEHIAWRIEPMDAKCRELTERYLLPVSYGANNIFLTNWTKDDYGELDFYDIFALFYKDTYQKDIPYIRSEDLTEKEEYDIGQEEFEKVIDQHFKISHKQLQKQLQYDAGKKCYKYSPRGYMEMDYCEIPYPEVESFYENRDGTVTLWVNAVYPNGNTSKLFSHEVKVVEEDDKIIYLSNKISEDVIADYWWHGERGIDEKGYNLPIDQNQQEQAKTDLEKIIEQIEPGISTYQNESQYGMQIPKDKLEELTNHLAKEGYIIKNDNLYSNVKNWEKLDSFLKKAQKGEKDELVLYDLRASGTLCRQRYYFVGEDLYVFSVSMIPGQLGKYRDNYCSNTKLDYWRYSESGWFCYELCVPEYPEVTEVVDGSVMILVKPMKEENIKASEKYVLGIGYQGNNILCSNWNQKNVEQLDFTGMYEYLYAIEYGKKFEITENEATIPAEEFEALIMKYIPVTERQIRQYADYDEAKKEYQWKKLGCITYSPTIFGTSYPVVTDIKNNQDGTITLTVDAVCEMLTNDESVITHEVTIQEQKDGSFRYLGNKILNDGIDEIPEYKSRRIPRRY